jgi:hypothetical protein
VVSRCYSCRFGQITIRRDGAWQGCCGVVRRMKESGARSKTSARTVGFPSEGRVEADGTPAVLLPWFMPAGATVCCSVVFVHNPRLLLQHRNPEGNGSAIPNLCHSCPILLYLLITSCRQQLVNATGSLRSRARHQCPRGQHAYVFRKLTRLIVAVCGLAAL